MLLFVLMSSIRVLITGGAGFLGSHLAEICLKEGNETLIYGDHLIGSGIEPLLPNARLIESSILDREGIRTACRGVDVVFHVAGITSVRRTMEDPLGTTQVNVNGTLEVLEAARLAEVRRFIFVSSATVYGDTPVTPVSEDVPSVPTSPYGLQKMIAEQYIQLWHSLFHIETTIIRPFNIYGPRQRGDSQHSGVIGRFFDHIRNGTPVVIHGDGQQIRDFVHVRDVADALLRSAHVPEANGKVFNIGSGAKMTVNQVLHDICDALDKPFDPTYESSQSGGILESVADISNARNILHWSPRVSFKEGIAELASLYK